MLGRSGAVWALAMPGGRRDGQLGAGRSLSTPPSSDIQAARTDRGRTAADRWRARSARLGSLARQDGARRVVPERRLAAGLVTTVGRSQGLRSPKVAMGTERGRFALVAAHHLVDVLAPDTVDVADPHRGQRAALDPVADRPRLPC